MVFSGIRVAPFPRARRPITNTLKISPLAASAKSGSASNSKQYEKYPMLMTHGHSLTSTSAAAWRGFMLAI
jgi:hypothetical protein